jgi:hypothetical protein
MNGTLALLIPILAISIGMVSVIGRNRIAEQKLKLRQQELSATGNAMHRETEIEIQKLKDRVAVLERLLTDDDRRLADEISRLGPRGPSNPGA